MLNTLQNPLSLLSRVLLALLFVPAGFAKIAGFAGTVGYIASQGVPLPQAWEYAPAMQNVASRFAGRWGLPCALSLESAA